MKRLDTRLQSLEDKLTPEDDVIITIQYVRDWPHGKDIAHEMTQSIVWRFNDSIGQWFKVDDENL